VIGICFFRIFFFFTERCELDAKWWNWISREIPPSSPHKSDNFLEQLPRKIAKSLHFQLHRTKLSILTLDAEHQWSQHTSGEYSSFLWLFSSLPSLHSFIGNHQSTVLLCEYRHLLLELSYVRTYEWKYHHDDDDDDDMQGRAKSLEIFDFLSLFTLERWCHISTWFLHANFSTCKRLSFVMWASADAAALSAVCVSCEIADAMNSWQIAHRDEGENWSA
jgi:hypothetical protein